MRDVLVVHFNELRAGTIDHVMRTSWDALLIIAKKYMTFRREATNSKIRKYAP
jgi:hypothetical protein